MINALVQRIIAKTASYAISVVNDRTYTRFTNRGAGGAVTFTLPPMPAANPGRYIGWRYQFYVVADQSFIIQAAAGKLVAFNNAAATSITINTGGQRIGAKVETVWDGTSWLCELGSVGDTYTIA